MKVRCPTCGKHDVVPDDFQWRPFCSRRCKMVDLGNWLDEVYKFSRPVGEDDISDDPGLLSQLLVGMEHADADRH